MHIESVVGMDSAPLRGIMVSISNSESWKEKLGTIKLWKANREDQSILVDKAYKMKVLSISMHPSGHVLAVNFPKEIKLLAIVVD